MMDLINLIGIPIQLYDSIKKLVRKLKENRVNKAFELISQKKLNYKAYIENNDMDFLKKFIITLESIEETEQEEKIELLCDLLIDKNKIEFDDYEERIKIINELTVKELMILSILFDLEKGKKNLPNYQRAKEIWNSFKSEIENYLQIYEEELDATLNRIVRTGCLNRVNGAGISNAYAYLTPLFYNIFDFISDKYRAKIKLKWLTK